jgi:hypothetical protein
MNLLRLETPYQLQQDKAFSGLACKNTVVKIQTRLSADKTYPLVLVVLGVRRAGVFAPY